MTFDPIRGRCSCGAVRFALTRPPMLVHCCHCRQCQTLTGSAFAVNAIIENAEIAHETGDLIVTPGPTEDPDAVHDLYRCAQCRTAVWADYGRRPNYRFVKVGTLETPERCPPDVHIFTGSKLSWVGLPHDVPQFEVFYELEEVWPPDALDRRKAALR
jgi:hypothetical protein